MAVGSNEVLINMAIHKTSRIGINVAAVRTDVNRNIPGHKIYMYQSAARWWWCVILG